MQTQRQDTANVNGTSRDDREPGSVAVEQQATTTGSVDESMHVCVACNLCCDGSLFNRVAVKPEEKERLQEKGRFYTKSNGEIRMRLGCHYLADNGQCECYKQRPRKCRTYQCELLKSVEAGIIPMQDAVSIVQEARMLRDKSNEASHAAIRAGGGSIAGTENVNELIRQVEELLNLSAPIPAPAVALAKYRYRCFVHWIRLYIKSDHLR